MNPITAIANKSKGMKDATLMMILNAPEHKKYLHDWRNWKEPVLKSMATEANKRGLIS